MILLIIIIQYNLYFKGGKEQSVITQDIKIACHNSVIKGNGAKSNDGHPWRNWKITLVAMDGEREVKGKLSMILDHVEYILHPTFEEPRRGLLKA